MPFFLTTLFEGPVLAVFDAFLCACARLPGVAYGGGLLERAASQSNGVEADRDGLVTGEKTSLVRGVVGALMGVRGEGPESLDRGELVAVAALAWARRRRDIGVGGQAVWAGRTSSAGVARDGLN